MGCQNSATVLVAGLHGRCPRFHLPGPASPHMTDRAGHEGRYQLENRRSGGIWLVRDKRSVKPSAKPTLVRTQHLPLPAETARELGFPGLAGLLAVVPLCFMMCRCGALRNSGYGHMADGFGAEQAVHRTAWSADFRGRPSSLRCHSGTRRGCWFARIRSSAWSWLRRSTSQPRQAVVSQRDTGVGSRAG